MLVHKLSAIGVTLRFYVKPYLQSGDLERHTRWYSHPGELCVFLVRVCSLKMFEKDRYPIKSNG